MRNQQQKKNHHCGFPPATTVLLWWTIGTLIVSGRGILGFSSSPADLDIVTRQLGYRPTNYVRVSARNRLGEPIAIQTYPLQGGAKRRQDKARQSATDKNLPLDWVPFPTLFWQTCPAIGQAIADLERQGFVKLLEQELLQQDDEAMRQQFLWAHQDYARRRWTSLAPEDRGKLVTLSLESTTVQRMRQMLEFSGIAGGNMTTFTTSPSTTYTPPAIKCLHTHYAHFRSMDAGLSTNYDDDDNDDNTVVVVNPIGLRVHEILIQEYPTLIL